MKNILKLNGILLLLMLSINCQNKSSINDEKNENLTADEGGNLTSNDETIDMISLQLRQLKIMNIELGSVNEMNLGVTLKANGQLELPPQNIASISSILGGRVERIDVIEGDYVNKGEVIAYLSNPEFIDLQREFLSAKSNFSVLEIDYQRKKELLKDGITSLKTFQKVEADYNDIRFDLNASQAKLEMLGTNISKLENGEITSNIPIKSPIKGYIQDIEINMGEYVSQEEKMFKIVDNEFLHLGLKVFEKDIDKVVINQSITFSLTTRPDKIFEAEIFALGKAFEMDTRAVKVHAKITGNHEGLLPGMFVDARIVTNDLKVKALPDGAFISEKGLDYIFIQTEIDDDDVTLKRIQVNKGVSDLGFSEVIFLENVPEKVIVVSKGAYYVNSELNKGEFEEHEH
jgi:cobalt-zinc-cadmium efflux system membrane fusion protein